MNSTGYFGWVSAAVSAAAAVLSLGCSPKTGGSIRHHPTSGSQPDSGAPDSSVAVIPDPSKSDGGNTLNQFDPGEGGVSATQLSASKVDLLFVIDDSSSMADKHQVLKAAVPDLLRRLANPVCVDAATGKTMQPKTAADPCTLGAREFHPVRDIHLGIVSSSLGVVTDFQSCPAAVGKPGNDGAHFIGTLPRGQSLPSYAGAGFLAWDPDKTANPPGETDLDQLVVEFTNMVDAVGQTGCGLESSLEAWYRALIDPEPTLDVVMPAPCAPSDGGLEAGADGSAACKPPDSIDHAVLAQRGKFLRDDSLVLIMMLTDENDCSLMHGPATKLIVQSSYTPRASEACATNPDDPCCYTCAQQAPAGCPTPDSSCSKGASTGEYPVPNLWCFDDKRRFGIDPLYPVQRYIDGLTKAKVPNAAGALVPNPLFKAGKRGLKDVFLVGIVGVPWEDTASDTTLKSADQLRLKSASDLVTDHVWDLVLGDHATQTPPTDGLMVESPVPRTGKNPVINAPLAPPTATILANPINGHERNMVRHDDLEYSCIFPLPSPRDCITSTSSCDCDSPSDGSNNPVCQASDGTYSTTQGFAKAYPPTRILQVLKGVGGAAVLSSICPKNVTDTTREDYGYRPVIGATIQDVAPLLLQ